jgi:hypothetical protein
MLKVSPEPGYVTGVYNAEDLVEIPGTRWLITSGMRGPGAPRGRLFLVDMGAKTSQEFFPVGASFAHDAERYGDAGAPDKDLIDAHGVSLRLGDDGVHTLYLVNHGGRESIEVIEVDARPDVPTATWIGAIIQDNDVWGNAVAALPDGGLVATNYCSASDPDAIQGVFRQELTGNVKEWQPGKGWSDVPGSELCSPNGIDVSPDGKWLFVCEWGPKRVVRISRGKDVPEVTKIDVPLLVDNIKWHDSGKLLTTGQVSDAKTVMVTVNGEGDHFAWTEDEQQTCDFGINILEIDPVTMEQRSVVEFYEEGGFGTATTAIHARDAVWVGSARANRVAYFPQALTVTTGAGA